MARSFATNATLGVCALVLVVFLAGRYTVQAGPLEPPAGPVGPTMRTIENVYDLLELHAGASASVASPLEYVSEIDVVSDTPFEVVSGSGVLHKVIIHRQSSPNTPVGASVRVSDGPLGHIGCFGAGGSGVATTSTELNIRFESGLFIRRDVTDNPADVTLLFRRDPPQ